MINYNEQSVLSNVVVGWEFEFYTNLNRKQAAGDLGKLLKKKVELGIVKGESKTKNTNSFYLEPDFSGGVKMQELITTPMPYHESIMIMTKVLGWIKSNGWTDEKCAIHINISFNEKTIKLPTSLQNINKLKFVLSFDEEKIYEKFPRRKYSMYARAINQIIPINKFIFSENITNIHKENYELPNDKYFGINFTKLNNKYFEVRYVGGRGYEKKGIDIINVLNYISLFTYSTLLYNESYTESELAKLKSVLKEHKKVVTSFSDLNNFFRNYPNIKLMVDLKADIQVLQTFFPVLREKIFDLIVRCGMKKGTLNYDTDVSKFQLKGAVIQRAFPISNMEIISSEISGNILNCDLYKCKITNSHLIDCTIVTGNTIDKSKIISSPIRMSNKVTSSYIDNKNFLIAGTIEGGIIRSGEVGKLAKISDTTEVIDKTILTDKGEVKLKGDKIGEK